MVLMYDQDDDCNDYDDDDGGGGSYFVVLEKVWICFFSNWLFYDSLQLSLAYTKIRVYHTKLEITPPVYYILSFMVFEGSIITGVIRL